MEDKLGRDWGRTFQIFTCRELRNHEKKKLGFFFFGLAVVTVRGFFQTINETIIVLARSYT